MAARATPYSAAILEEQANNLSRVALLLDMARQQNDPRALAAALAEDLELWVAIKTVAEAPETVLTREIRQNLVRLSNFVADTIMKKGVTVGAATLDTLINVNLQICEGLLESLKKTTEAPTPTGSSSG
jgi:flagellar biosynthesis regulator FlaF